MLVTDEMVETALGILFPLNAAFNEGAHERLKAKIRSALEATLSHAAGQDGEQCRAASGGPPFLTDSSGRLHSGEDIELLCQALERIADGALEFEADEGCVRTAAGLLRALSRGVPEGMVLVPVEPTPEMETAHRMYGDTSDWWQAVTSAAIAAQRKGLDNE